MKSDSRSLACLRCRPLCLILQLGPGNGVTRQWESLARSPTVHPDKHRLIFGAGCLSLASVCILWRLMWSRGWDVFYLSFIWIVLIRCCCCCCCFHGLKQTALHNERMKCPLHHKWQVAIITYLTLSTSGDNMNINTKIDYRKKCAAQRDPNSAFTCAGSACAGFSAVFRRIGGACGQNLWNFVRFIASRVFFLEWHLQCKEKSSPVWQLLAPQSSQNYLLNVSPAKMQHNTC